MENICRVQTMKFQSSITVNREIVVDYRALLPRSVDCTPLPHTSSTPSELV